MNLYEFLGDPGLQLPLKRDSENFQAFVESTLDAYLRLLSELDAPATVVDEVREHQTAIYEFCRILKEVVRSAHKGRPFEAYKLFSEGMSPLTPFLNQLAANLVTPDQLGTLYRVRRHVTPDLKREDLFHVPFESRHRVATQR